MIYDTTETVAGSTIQHGKANDRIYLMRLAPGRAEEAVGALDRLARRNRYSKIFAKVRASEVEPFLRGGYAVEAEVPRFHRGAEAACFLGRYLDPARAIESDPDMLDAVVALAGEKARDPAAPLPSGCAIRLCEPCDAGQMAGIYRAVFATYPFPIHDPDYLIETMRSHVDYHAVESDGRLVALASAEMDPKALSVEMTDFATLPDWRSHGFGLHLLNQMNRALPAKGILTAYTIARAASPGMNITFARAGYLFAGRLKNNTQISGRIESMNVWYRPL